MKKFFSILLMIITFFLPISTYCQKVTVNQKQPTSFLKKRKSMVYGTVAVFSKPAKYSLEQLTLKKAYIQNIAPSGIKSQEILEKVPGKALTYEEAICFINTITESFSDEWYDGCGISFIMNHEGTFYLVNLTNWRYCSSDSNVWKWYLTAYPLKNDSNSVWYRGLFVYR